MNQYITPYADLEGMLDALYIIAKDRWDRWGKSNSSSDAWAVDDAKTIGLIGGRQCGLTTAALRWIAKRPGQCIYITKDVITRDKISKRYFELALNDDEEYTALIPYNTNNFSYWTDKVQDIKDTVRYIIIDDSKWVFNNTSMKRSDFNKWVAETFHPDTFVILIK